MSQSPAEGLNPNVFELSSYFPREEQPFSKLAVCFCDVWFKKKKKVEGDVLKTKHGQSLLP